MSSETQQIILKKWESLDDKVGSVCFIITSPQALKLDFHLLLLSNFYRFLLSDELFRNWSRFGSYNVYHNDTRIS